MRLYGLGEETGSSRIYKVKMKCIKTNALVKVGFYKCVLLVGVTVSAVLVDKVSISLL